MSTSAEILLRLAMFEGIVFLLLTAMLLGQYFLKQPLERIRLTQFGLGIIAVLFVFIAVPFGPKFLIPLPQGATKSHATPEITHVTVSQDEPVFQEPVQMTKKQSQEPQTAIPVQPSMNNVSSGDVLPHRVPVAQSTEAVTVSEPMSSGIVEEKRANAFLSFAVLLAFCVPPLVLLLREVNAQFRLRAVRRNSSCVSEHVARMFDEIFGTSRTRVSLMVSKQIDVPIIFGFFHTTLLLPNFICSTVTPSQTLRACLLHEWSHIKRGDLITWNLLRWFQYLLWLQPFYWMLRPRLLTDQDYLADHESAMQIADQTEYAEVLLNLAKSRTQKIPNSVLGMAGHKSQLKQRIEMLFETTKPMALKCCKRNLFPIVCVLILLMLIGGSIRFGGATTAQEIVQKKKLSQTLLPISIEKTAEKGFHVSGIVYDQEGKPAAGAAVLLYEGKNSGSSEADGTTPPIRTNSDGSFTFTIKKLFCVLVRSADGRELFFYKIPEELKQTDPKEWPAIVMQLKPGEALTGRVVDKAGKPVADATVGYYSHHRINHMVKSDADGHFAIFYPKGPEVLALFAFKSHEGFDYQLFGSELDVPKMQEKSDVVFSQPFTLTFSGAEPVRLKMLWDDGTPATGITIAPWTLRNPNQKLRSSSPVFADPSFNFALLQYFTRKTVDENGVVEFDWMPNWLEQVDFFYADFPWLEPNRLWLRVKLDFTAPANDPHEKTIILNRAKKVSGTVRFPDGKPAEGITVKYQGVNMQYEIKHNSTQTDANGHYEMEIFPEAAYVLAVENNDWAAPSYNPLVLKAETKPEELNKYDFTLQSSTHVHGRVVFGAEKKLLQGYTLVFELTGKSDLTLPKEKQLKRTDGRERNSNDLRYYIWQKTSIDEQGNYSIHLGPGEYELSINEPYIGRDGFIHDLLPEEKKSFLIPENTTEITHDLVANASLNGTLRGNVLLENGEPAANAALVGAFYEDDRVTQSATPDFSTTTDSNGHFDAPRSLQIMKMFVKSADGKEQTVMPLDAKTESLNDPIKLKKTGTSIGRVVDLLGNPMPGIELRYGIMVYGIFDDDKQYDQRRNFPQRIRGPLRFGDVVKTDANGQFRIPSAIVDTNCYVVYPIAKSYQLGGNDTFQLAMFRLNDPGEERNLGDCPLNPASLDGWVMPNPGQLPKFTAQFFDDQTGKPIIEQRVEVFWSLKPADEPNATTRIYPENVQAFTGEDLNTDAEGKITFSCPVEATVYDPKDVRVTIRCFSSFRSDEDWKKSPYAPFSETISGPFESSQDFTFRIIPYPTVSGKILDPEGKPIPGASLFLHTARSFPKGERDNEYPIHKEFEATTDSNGVFRAMVSPGFNQGRLECNAPGFVPCTIDLKGKRSDNEEDWVFTMKTGIDVSGRITDPSGNGIAEAWVNFSRKTINGKPLGDNTYAMHCDQLGRSVKTDAQGNFTAPSLDHEDYEVLITEIPCSPNAENVPRLGRGDIPKPFEKYVFATKTVDLRSEKKSPPPLSIAAHPTVAITFVCRDETKDKNSLAYSHFSFHGTFPETGDRWSIQPEKKYDPQSRDRMTGAAHVPKGLPISLSGSLLGSYDRRGVTSILNEHQDWTMEYRYSPDDTWKPCERLKTDPSDGTPYLHFSTPLGPKEQNLTTLEIRIR